LSLNQTDIYDKKSVIGKLSTKYEPYAKLTITSARNAAQPSPYERDLSPNNTMELSDNKLRLNPMSAATKKRIDINLKNFGEKRSSVD